MTSSPPPPEPDEGLDATSQRPITAAAGTPAAEVDIDPELVARLLADQCPDLAELPLRELASGWDNVMYRLGPDLVVRLPRRSAIAARARPARQRPTGEE
ncbi:MAG: hypothetical protein AAFO29_13695, partial [Actinomycetota bacterium]